MFKTKFEKYPATVEQETNRELSIFAQKVAIITLGSPANQHLNAHRSPNGGEYMSAFMKGGTWHLRMKHGHFERGTK